ncbi:hypothetical protein [Aliiglaciecola lipolytica]|uniref:STAS domain-containing protein n=1 Tax=Aliiglaciecola lipolytica E3 TaxID=1127673 RepID=K6WZK8_9ALTE|nr:hypothetical protein [Aliiglaciecola lipolytica]GAC13839.1 hypothetical protein GLIP_1198 [Aliiglaciecola lipolytica E3]
MKKFRSAHGNVDIVSVDTCVKIKVQGGFNQEGIIRYGEIVLSVVPVQTRWILVNFVGSDTGLTPDAVGELLNQYQRFIKFNCVAICENVDLAFGAIVKQQVLSKLNIPTLVSQDETEIAAFLAANSNQA